MRHDVIVVGGGQAGLAIGYFLAEQGRDFAILEAADEPAAAWRRRWDSLRLFTPVRYSSLPGLPFPGDPDSYPTRDEVAAYLTDYADHFDLPVELNSRVRSIRKAGRGYLVELDDGAYAADQVVVATGPVQVPFIPPIAARLDSSITQLHSSAYRAPGTSPANPPSWSGAATPAFRSRRSSRAHGRSIYRSGHARRRSRSACWAATSSGTSRRRG